MKDWTCVEELRPQIPEWFFGLLCALSGPPGAITRRWMLWQPFRSVLFRKVEPSQDSYAAACTECGGFWRDGKQITPPSPTCPFCGEDGGR